MSIIPESPEARERLFNTIKYLTYGWLAINGYIFYSTEVAIAGVSFTRGLSLSEIIEVYSATIDTIFWFLLILLLELETWVLEDDVLKKPAVKWSMIGLRSICYIMITYALYGYIVKSGFQSDIIPFAFASACDVVNQNYNILLELEEYIPLTAGNCETLEGQQISQLNGHNIIAPHDTLIYARNVAWIDNFNAATWLCIVAILEVDIWFQLKGIYKGMVLNVSTYLKILFYTILFACAVAWGYTGVFVDFMDAFLWIFAFFFIERNLVEWQKETEEANIHHIEAFINEMDTKNDKKN